MQIFLDSWVPSPTWRKCQRENKVKCTQGALAVFLSWLIHHMEATDPSYLALFDSF